MTDAPETTAANVDGVILGQYKKCQYLGHCELPLQEQDHKLRMKEIHTIANNAMHVVHKDHKHRHLGYSQCYVTTEGVYLYEAEKKDNTTPKLAWGKPCKEIYCVVMGKRTHLTHNQMACLMMFANPGSKPVFPVPMECVIVEFHHDHKNAAAKFHKSCENMMKALLSNEMHKLAVGAKDGAVEADEVAEDADVEGAVTENSNYFEVPVEGEAPEIIESTGKKARASISAATEDGGNDYMTVVIADTGGMGTLADALAEDSSDEDL